MSDLIDKFQRLVKYQGWTDTILGNLAYAVDQANIRQIQAQLEQTLQTITPADFRNWISSDILHPGHTLENLHHAICDLTLFELSMAIDEWHRRLMDSLRILEERKPRLLCCGPGAVVDQELPADTFLRGFRPDDELLNVAKVRNPGRTAKDKADVLALLWQAAKQPGRGLKPYLDNPELRKEFAAIFKSFSSASKSELGGAQFIMARANRRINAEANVAWPYHPEQVAGLGRNIGDSQSLYRVVIEDNKRIRELPFDNNELNHPCRQSYILNITPEMMIAGTQAIGSDRVIFCARRYSTNDLGLTQATLKCRHGEIKRPLDWQPQEWLSLPLIGTVKITKNEMTFYPADDQVLASLATEYHYKRFIWTGLTSLDDPGFSKQDRQILAREIAHQMEVLKDEGSLIYLELSSVPQSPELVRQIVAGRVTCVGINQTELVQLTNSYPIMAWPNPSQRAEPLLGRYYRGLRLAEYLGTDLFIHGNECSMYLTKSQAETHLKKIVSAILVAKLVVIEQLLTRTMSLLHIQQPSLAEKGFMALLQFAHDFARLRGNKNLVSQIMYQGYLCAQASSDYSFAIVPVLWPEEVQRVNPTGAGDMISGIFAALLPDTN